MGAAAATATNGTTNITIGTWHRHHQLVAANASNNTATSKTMAGTVGAVAFAPHGAHRRALRAV